RFGGLGARFDPIALLAAPAAAPTTAAAAATVFAAFTRFARFAGLNGFAFWGFLLGLDLLLILLFGDVGIVLRFQQRQRGYLGRIGRRRTACFDAHPCAFE